MSLHRHLARPAVRAAGIRVLGAVAVAAGVVIGVRALGPAQFGVSVLVLAAGQIAALPVTSSERLAIRLAAAGLACRTREVLNWCDRYSWFLVLTTVSATLVAGLTVGAETAWFVLSSGTTAVVAGLLPVRQGVNRVAGRLVWGQAPNELVRPVVTIVGYYFAPRVVPSATGAAATFMASLVTLVVILLAPLEIPRTTAGSEGTGSQPLRSAFTGLFVVSVIAALIDRGYPLAVGALSSSVEVARLAVVVRVIQLGLFGQAFAIFFYSPALARALSGPEPDLPAAVALSRRIRVVGWVCAAPFVLCCIGYPRGVELLIGGSVDLRALLLAAGGAIVAQTLTGPTQTSLVMAGKEGAVAMTYLVAFAVGLTGFLALGGDASAAVVGMLITYVVWFCVQAVQTRVLIGRFI